MVFYAQSTGTVIYIYIRANGEREKNKERKRRGVVRGRVTAINGFPLQWLLPSRPVAVAVRITTVR